MLCLVSAHDWTKTKGNRTDWVTPPTKCNWLGPKTEKLLKAKQRAPKGGGRQDRKWRDGRGAEEQKPVERSGRGSSGIGRIERKSCKAYTKISKGTYPTTYGGVDCCRRARPCVRSCDCVLVAQLACVKAKQRTACGTGGGDVVRCVGPLNASTEISEGTYSIFTYLCVCV